MVHRLAVRIALVAAAAGVPSAVIAKQNAAPVLFTAADVDRIAPAIDHNCILGDATKTATPDQKVANCTAAIAAVEPMAAKAKTLAERAGFAFMIASFDFARAGGYLRIDLVRSARVCESAERVYAKLASIDAALFDADIVPALQSSRGAVSRSAAACRKDFGTPKGAPALLPQ